MNTINKDRKTLLLPDESDVGVGEFCGLVIADPLFVTTGEIKRGGSTVGEVI